MNNFKNRRLFIVLTMAAFSIMALAAYTLSTSPTRPEASQNER